MEENRIRQIKAVVTWTVLWMAVLVLLSMVCVASSGLLPAETVGQWVWFDKASFLLAGCILSALIFKSKGDFISLDSVISWVLVVLGGSEAILGLRQLYGFATSGHSMCALTGSFFNPGPYSGYLAMILPVCLYQWLVCGRRGGTCCCRWCDAAYLLCASGRNEPFGMVGGRSFLSVCICLAYGLDG